MSLVRLISCVLLHSLALATPLISKPKLLIAHRGAPCKIPDETLLGYQDAVSQGMDFLEMDLVLTRDSHLLLRHDVTLDDSTTVLKAAVSNAAFHGKNSTYVITDGGPPVNGFFAVDFDFAATQQLRAVQPMAQRDQSLNGHYFLIELQQVVEVLQSARAAGTQVGLYIELKNDWFHQQRGLDIVAVALDALQGSGLTPAELQMYVVIQSFEFEALRRFSDRSQRAGLDIPLVWLLACPQQLPDDAQLAELAGLASVTAVGVDKMMLVDAVGAAECGQAETTPVCAAAPPTSGTQTCAGRLVGGTGQLSDVNSIGKQFVALAHSIGVLVHVWTFRNEGQFILLDFEQNALQEMDAYLLSDNIGADGAFTDCPDTANEWRQLHPDPPPPAPPPPPFPFPPPSPVDTNLDLTKPTPFITWLFVAFVVLLAIGCCVTGYLYHFGPGRKYERMGQERQQALAKYGVDLDEIQLLEAGNDTPLHGQGMLGQGMLGQGMLANGDSVNGNHAALNRRDADASGSGAHKGGAGSPNRIFTSLEIG